MSDREHIMNTLIILGLGFWHLFPGCLSGICTPLVGQSFHLVPFG